MMEAVINNGTGFPVRARGFDRSRRGQDRHLARRLVRRLHQQPAVHRVGGQRRLHRHEAGRRHDCRAHLGGVHEARGEAAAVLGHEGIHCAAGRGDAQARQGDQPPRDAVVSADDYTVAFIAGTEPKETCEQSFGDHRGFFTKIFGLGSPPVTAPPASTNGSPQGIPGVAAPPGSAAANAPPGQAEPRKKKHGFFSRLFGKGDRGDEEQNNGTGSANNGNPTSPR